MSVVIALATLGMDKLKLTGRALGRVFNFRSGCMHTLHLLPNVAIRPNLELKTRPKQLLGSLPLVISLPALGNATQIGSCTWVKFVGKSIDESNRRCTCLGHLGWCGTDRIISLCVVSPKVAKVSTVVTVQCCCRWLFHVKTSPMEIQFN